MRDCFKDFCTDSIVQVVSNESMFLLFHLTRSCLYDSWHCDSQVSFMRENSMNMTECNIVKEPGEAGDGFQKIIKCEL